MSYGTHNVISVTLELGIKSRIFFVDVMTKEDALFDKTLEGFALFAFNQDGLYLPRRALGKINL